MIRLLLGVALGAAPAAMSAAQGAECDLSEVIGYGLISGKIIDGYIDGGQRHNGFDGCTRDRVLVFADNTGVRCQDTLVHHADRPRGFLFARSVSDMKLCVDGSIYRVASPN